MKVKLLKQNRIDGKAGDIVEVTPARAAFLLKMGLAEPVLIREQIEVPEKKAKAARKTTRTKK
jgi:ribosomal protein L9